MIKSGYYTTVCNGADHGVSEMNHHQHTKGWFSPKEGDAMCVDWKGVLYYDLLPENLAVNSKKYCSHLNQLRAALDEKWPDFVNRKHIMFHQNNARPHVCLMTRQNLLQFGWEVVIYMFYAPDIAPLNSHLFQFLHNSLNGKNFNSLEDCKSLLEQFFAQKDKKFG